MLVKQCATGNAGCQSISQIDLSNHMLVHGEDGKIYVFNNGILNTEPQALENAAKQQGDKALVQGVYTIINPYTGNALSEVIYAGVDKLREMTGLFGMSNAAQANIDLRNLVEQYNHTAAVNGKTPLQIIEVDHSRGSLTSSIATQEQVNAGQTAVALNTIIFNGAAANAERMANAVDQVTGGKGQVMEATHKDDLVGAVVGGNGPVGGTDTTFLKAHTSYTKDLPPQLTLDGKINPLRSSTDDVWGFGQISKPVLVPPTSNNGGK
jgi:filamentous hemagglutinin